MKPYIVLGNYRPNRTPWRAWRTGRDLLEITGRAGLVPHYDPAHGPEPGASWKDVDWHAQVRRYNLGGPGNTWHYDGDDTPNANPECWMVLWANCAPTLIRWKDGDRVYQPDPFEIVVFSNLGTLHRRPDDAPRDRWTFRQRIRSLRLREIAYLRAAERGGR